MPKVALSSLSKQSLAQNLMYSLGTRARTLQDGALSPLKSYWFASCMTPLPFRIGGLQYLYSFFSCFAKKYSLSYFTNTNTIVLSRLGSWSESDFDFLAWSLDSAVPDERLSRSCLSGIGAS